MPFPVKVPPAGLPVRFTDGSVFLYDDARPIKLTTGKLFTVTVLLLLALQPLPSV